MFLCMVGIILYNVHKPWNKITKRSDPIWFNLCYILCVYINVSFFSSFIFIPFTSLRTLSVLSFSFLFTQEKIRQMHMNTHTHTHIHIQMNFRPFVCHGKRYDWLKSKSNDCRNNIYAFMSLKLYKRQRDEEKLNWAHGTFENVVEILFFIFYFFIIINRILNGKHFCFG